MDNENITALDDLINAKRGKKKKDPTAGEKKQFLEAWIDLTSDEGFSERAERYLYDGFAFCGAEPFRAYLKHAQDPNKALTSLFTGKVYGENTDATFRMLTHLLALLLNENAEQNILAPIIKRLPGSSLNREKKRSGNAGKTMEKYFFAELNTEAELLPLNRIETKKVFIDEFCEMMLSIIESMKQTRELKKKVTANVSKVEAWIFDYSNSQEKNSDTGASQHFQIYSLKKHVLQDAPEKCQKTEDQTPEHRTTEEDLNAYFSELLAKVNKTASAIRAESTQQKNKADLLGQTLEAEHKKTQRAYQQIEEMKEMISSLQQNLLTAESEVAVLKKRVEQNEATIAEKEAEISERIKMADVLGRDRTKQTDEALQRLASKIRIEYRDFQDAVNIPMSCDLGENFRLQLQNVFDILEKGGMKIK